MLTRNMAVAGETAEQRREGSGAPASLVWRAGRHLLQAILMIAILAAGFMGMQWLIATKPQVPTRPAFPTIYTVDMVTAERGDYRPSFIAYGEIIAGRSVDLRALVSGEVIAVSDSLKPGDDVQAGEALVEIDRFNYEGALREARANIAETRARIAESEARIAIERTKLERSREQLQLAQSDLERIAALADRGTATEKQVEDRELLVSQRAATVEQTEINITAEEARLAQQEAALERLEWKADQAGRNLDDTVLRAPFDGVVRSTDVETGKMVGANDVVVSIYERGNLEVRFTLSDARFGRIQSEGDGLIGREVEVIWSAGPTENRLSGTIVRLGADIAANRGGVEVIAALRTGDGQTAPRPGAFVEIVVSDRLFEDHFRLPETALYDGGTIYAVVDERLQARRVAVSAFDGEYALVTGELEPGEEILATRIAEIGEGLRVRKEAADEPAAAETSSDAPAPPRAPDTQ